MSRYDRAITVFSPDGHLFQVEYALEAVRKGSTAVGVRGKESVILAVERKTTAKLQDSRTVKKIVKLDDHISLAFAGLKKKKKKKIYKKKKKKKRLTADARVLIDKARVECQSYRLSFEDQVSVEYITRYIAQVQQKYTQSGGVRPFGISTLIAGFDVDGTPKLYQTDPSGSFSEWKASSCGRNSKTVREYLEKNYETCSGDDEETIKLAVRALLEVVESGSKNVEVVQLKNGKLIELDESTIEKIVTQIEKEKKEEEEKKKKKTFQSE